MKSIVFSLAFTVFMLGAPISGYDQSQPNNANNQANNTQPADVTIYIIPRETGVLDNKQVTDSIDQFKTESNARLSKLDKDIAELKDKIARGTNATKQEYKIALADMEKQSAELKVKISAFKEKSSVKWHEFKTDFNKDMDKLKNAISDLGKKNSQ
jgi:gas vesicle protein